MDNYYVKKKKKIIYGKLKFVPLKIISISVSKNVKNFFKSPDINESKNGNVFFLKVKGNINLKKKKKKKL